jgi:YD repeat-containing protein
VDRHALSSLPTLRVNGRRIPLRGGRFHAGLPKGHKGPTPSDDRIWILTYDQLNRRDTAINPDNSIDDNDYDDNDLLTKAIRTKPGGSMFSGTEDSAPPIFLWGTSFTYDERNRMKTSTKMTDDQGSGFTTKYIPDKDGDIVQIIDPLGKKRTNVYDVRKRLKQVLDCDDSVMVEYEYDEDDRQVVVKRPDPNSNALIVVQRTVYNAKGEVKETYDAFNNRIALNTYDIAGNLIERVDVDGVRTKYSYDDLDRLTQVVTDEGPGRLNLTITHVYDDNGNRIQSTDPRGKVYKFVYNKANQLEKLEYPSLDASNQHFERWKFNVLGQASEYQVGRQEPGNPPTNIIVSRKSTYGYDVLGRLNEEKHDLDNNGTFETTVTRSYTDAGPLDIIDDGTIKLDFDYDSLNRVTLVSWYYQGALFKTVGTTYDESSNKKTMTGPEGDVTDYGYDNNNRLVTLHRNKAGVRTLIQLIEYDRGGRRKKVILGNGLATRYFYNSRDEMVAMRTFNASDQLVHSVVYQYRADGNRSQVDFEHLNVTARFQFDAVDRLTGEVWTGNTCNEFPNALLSNIGNESGFSPSGAVTPAAILAVQPHYQFYAYDANGNRTNLTGITRGATYEYDNENRLMVEYPTAPVKMTGTTASASDTETGFTPNRINDGDTGEATDPACAWKSQNTAVSHTADITWSAAENITQVRVFIPGGGAQRFKIQYFNGSDWVNATVQNVIGAQQIGMTEWYQTMHQVNIFEISSVSTTGIRFVQDIGGGPSSQPNVAILNELEAYKPVSQNDITYTYDDHGNQLSRTQGTTIEEFGYDYANRLNLYKKTINSVLNTHFVYRATPMGDRFQKVNVLAPMQEERYVSDGRDTVSDYFICDGQFRVKNTYIQGLGIDSKIARFETTYGPPPACIPTELAPLYYLGDALGTVTGVRRGE